METSLAPIIHVIRKSFVDFPPTHDNATTILFFFIKICKDFFLLITEIAKQRNDPFTFRTVVWRCRPLPFGVFYRRQQPEFLLSKHFHFFFKFRLPIRKLDFLTHRLHRDRNIWSFSRTYSRISTERNSTRPCCDAPPDSTQSSTRSCILPSRRWYHARGRDTATPREWWRHSCDSSACVHCWDYKSVFRCKRLSSGHPTDWQLYRGLHFSNTFQGEILDKTTSLLTFSVWFSDRRQ